MESDKSYTPIFGEKMCELIINSNKEHPRDLRLVMREMADTCASIVAPSIQSNRDKDFRMKIGELFVSYFLQGYQKNLEYLDSLEDKIS
jgi:hypothetical protein